MTRSEAKLFFKRELEKTKYFKGMKGRYIPMNAGECYEAFAIALEALNQHPSKKKK